MHRGIFRHTLILPASPRPHKRGECSRKSIINTCCGVQTFLASTTGTHSSSSGAESPFPSSNTRSKDTLTADMPAEHLAGQAGHSAPQEGMATRVRCAHLQRRYSNFPAQALDLLSGRSDFSSTGRSAQRPEEPSLYNSKREGMGGVCSVRRTGDRSPHPLGDGGEMSIEKCIGAFILLRSTC